MILADRYELGEALGGGGMSRVVRGYDRALEREVAVKLLRDDHARGLEARQRFLREARRASRLAHPNVVKVFDAGVDDDQPWMVLELVEGPSLAEVVARRGPLPPGEAVALTSDVLAGLAAVHAAGLVHRDVKPANVLLTADGTAKLADFGIAKAADEAGLTATGSVVGTPRYLAPEQVAGEPATPRTDVYAAGILLYELLAGAPPFVAGTPIAVAIAHQQAPVPPLAARRPDVDPAVVAVVERALSKAPEQRFADALAMRVALTGAAAGTATPTLAMPATPAAAAPADNPRRRPVLLGATAVAVLALAALGLGLAADPPAPPSPVPTLVASPPTTAAAGVQPAGPLTAAWPTDLAGLITALAQRSDGGPRAGELGTRLQDLAGKEGHRQAEDARKVLDDVARWAEAGELDTALAAAAAVALEPYLTAPDEDERDEDEQDEQGGEGKDKDGEGERGGPPPGRGPGNAPGRD